MFATCTNLSLLFITGTYKRPSVSIWIIIRAWNCRQCKSYRMLQLAKAKRSHPIHRKAKISKKTNFAIIFCVCVLLLLLWLLCCQSPYEFQPHARTLKLSLCLSIFSTCFYQSTDSKCFSIRTFICRFVQSWSVRNNGEEVWPYGCYIKSTSNENLPMVPVEPIEPGQCTVISVSLRSPCELGSFQTKWRLFTSNGSCFGGKFWPTIGLFIPVNFRHMKHARPNAL